MDENFRQAYIEEIARKLGFEASELIAEALIDENSIPPVVTFKGFSFFRDVDNLHTVQCVAGEWVRVSEFMKRVKNSNDNR